MNLKRLEKMKMAGRLRHCPHCGHELCDMGSAFSKEEIAEVEGLTGEEPDRWPDRWPTVREALENPEAYARKLIQERKRRRDV